MDYSPASSSSSSIHHASLVDASTHSPALLELIDLKLSRPIIEYIVGCTVDVVDYAMGRPPSSSSRGRSSTRQTDSFTTFVSNVITRAEVNVPTMLATLVYIDRARPHLHIALEEWAHERVFLGAVMVASKYLNDSTLKNVHWALCTGVFGKRDVGRIEREFLDVLNFELSITEADILSHHAGLSAIAIPSPPSVRRTRNHQRSSPVSDTVPQLSPSSTLSPSSSTSSSGAPRTPSTVSSLPQSSERPHKKSKSFHLSTLDLIRSFPMLHHGSQVYA